jgi:pimeloyl-ACP methyl ester carboxylesterase
MTTTSTATIHRRLDVGDAELEYWERGPRDATHTVFLVHAGVFGEWFRPMFDEPALDGFRVVRVHRAGYGTSSRPRNHLTLADHARQCCRLLRELGVRRAHWIGHSSSGCIGLQAALDDVDLIAGLVLLEPAPNPAGPSSQVLAREVVGPAMAAVGAGDFAQATDTFLRGVAGPDYRAVLTARLGEDAFDRIVRDATFFFTNEIRAAGEWNLDPERASRITVPALLVTGGASAAVTNAYDETATILAAMLPAGRHIVVPGLNHSMPVQDPARVARLVAEVVAQ